MMEGWSGIHVIKYIYNNIAGFDNERLIFSVRWQDPWMRYRIV
jgi:hypothetical protein